MKKRLAFLGALLITGAMATSAFAAQAMYTTVKDDGSSMGYYLSTPIKFAADSKTNYPNEIYLPNEVTPAQYRIHTNYTKDTDSCASCHATHTAVGQSLLQWYSVYETCMACHDGTVTTTYNVDDGEIGASGEPTYGGHFGFSLDNDETLSNHNVSGNVEIAGAPGGSVVEQTIAASDVNPKAVTMWKKSFGCESCHTPHGQGGNARILHPDPNGWATKTQIKEYEVTTVNGLNAVVDGTTPVTLLKGYPYKIIIAGTNVDLTNKFKISNIGDSSVGSFTYLEAISDATVDQIAYVKGIATIKVRMNIEHYLGQDNEAESVQHVEGINAFCGACHVDYNTEDEVAAGNGSETIMGTGSKRPGFGNLNGEYSKAYRHAVGLQWNYGEAADKQYIGSDKLMLTAGKSEDKQYITCLTCHFAHGTSQEMWTDWLNKYTLTGWETSELNEVAGSSALKRLPNMGTCEACHQKADAAQGYSNNTTQGDVKPVATEFANQVNATFVGKEACRKCHAQTVAAYEQTAHSQMSSWTTDADKNTWYGKVNGEKGTDPVLGDYTKFPVGSSVYTFYKKDFVLNVSWNHNTLAAVANENQKLYLIFSEGAAVPTGGAPEEYGCVRCHNTPAGASPDNGVGATSNWTDMKARYDAGELELGIQCETSGCHSNGSLHVQSPSSKNIKNPGSFSMQDQSNAKSCGVCHGSRHHQGEFWNPIWADLNNNHADDAFEKVDSNKGPSPMFAAGVVSCITCHSPHSNTVDDTSRKGVAKHNLQLTMPVRSLCNSCHDGAVTVLTGADFDKYLPLKINGMPSHVFKGQGYLGLDATGLGYDPKAADFHEHRAH